MDTQFEREVCHLIMLKHPNIVRCVGYCYQIHKKLVQHNGESVFAKYLEMLLCLEYLPTGNLTEYLSGMTFNMACCLLISSSIFFTVTSRSCAIFVNQGKLYISYRAYRKNMRRKRKKSERREIPPSDNQHIRQLFTPDSPQGLHIVSDLPCDHSHIGLFALKNSSVALLPQMPNLINSPFQLHLRLQVMRFEVCSPKIVCTKCYNG